MMKSARAACATFGVFLLLLATACTARSRVVRAVLFYSPNCPHCMDTIHAVIEPAQKQFGESLDLLWIDVTSKKGRDLYQECLNVYQVPDERITVPIVALGRQALIGDEITTGFVPAVESGLKTGVDWPALSGLP